MLITGFDLFLNVKAWLLCWWFNINFGYLNRFEKKVRYASRKARADVRRRVKGRFVKAGDVYDYDPLSQTRSF